MIILSSLLAECSSRVCELPGLMAAPVKMVGDASSVVLGVAASVLALTKLGTDKELNRFADRTTRLHGGHLFTRPYVAMISVLSPQVGTEGKNILKKKDDYFEKTLLSTDRKFESDEDSFYIYSHSMISWLLSSQIFDLGAYLAHYGGDEQRKEQTSSPQPVSERLGRFAVREIASRFIYAVATITAIATRSLDLISGLTSALVSLGTGGYFPGLNGFAFFQLQAGAGLAEICIGVRAIFGDVRQCDRLDFLDKEHRLLTMIDWVQPAESPS